MFLSVITYLLSFIISIILCYIYEKKINKESFKNRLLWTLIIIAPTVILSGIRYKVGTDYICYENDFYQDKFNVGFNYFIKEPLNFLLMVVVYKIYPNATLMFFVYSFIIMFVFFKAIDYYRDRISVTLSLFIFYMTYYLVSYNVIRQMIAVIIILYATRYIFNSKFWKYLFCIVLAGMIHKTAYLMIVLYFLNDENLKFLNKIKLLKKIKDKVNLNTKSMIIYIVLGFLPVIFIPLIPNIIKRLGIYRTYLSSNVDMSFGFLLYVLPVLFIVFLKRTDILKENRNNDFFIRCLIMQIPFQLMGGIIKYTDRFSMYVAIMQVILLPIIFKNLDNSKKDKLLKISIIGWYIFYFIVMFIILNSNGVLPYKTIFNKELV